MWVDHPRQPTIKAHVPREGIGAWRRGGRGSVVALGVIVLGVVMLTLAGGCSLLPMDLEGTGKLDPESAQTQAAEIRYFNHRIAEARQQSEAKMEDRQARFRLARWLYLAGAAGDEKAGEAALALLTELAGVGQEEALTLAYLGGAQLWDAQRVANLRDRARRTEEGLRLVDRAAALAPQDVEVKLIRGLATQHLPTFLQRLKQSEEDIRRAADLAVAWVNQGKLERELAAAALHQDGVICLGQADLAGAAEAWRAAVAISPDTPSGRQAAWRLDRLEKSVGKKP